MPGHAGGCQQVGDRHFVYRRLPTAQLAVHGGALENLYVTRGHTECAGIDDDQGITGFDFGQQGQPQRAAVEEADGRVAFGVLA